MFDVIDERTELARPLRGQQNDQLTPEGNTYDNHYIRHNVALH